jgi:hypothetical protein
MIKEILAGICFVLFFYGLIAATSFVEPINETVIETRGE